MAELNLSVEVDFKKAFDEAVERARLESAVVEAAKEWWVKPDDEHHHKWNFEYPAMCEAIRSLLQFEQEHK